MECMQASTEQTKRARYEPSFKKDSAFPNLKELYGCGPFGIFERKTLNSSKRFRVTRGVTSIVSKMGTKNSQLKDTRSCTTLDTPKNTLTIQQSGCFLAHSDTVDAGPTDRRRSRVGRTVSFWSSRSGHNVCGGRAAGAEGEAQFLGDREPFRAL